MIKCALGLFAALLAVLAFWHGGDLFFSNLFYEKSAGFYMAEAPFFLLLHWLAFYGARFLFVVFLLAVFVAFIGKRKVMFLDAKAWLFLLLALVIGPGLIVNEGFKNNWGRSRPREISEFNGSQSYSPFWRPQFDRARSNGSFVSGDAAFGFFLPTLAFVVPRRRARYAFVTCLIAGACFGLARIGMGAHFLSDVIVAAFVVLATSSLLYGLFYGRGFLLKRLHCCEPRGAARASPLSPKLGDRP